MLIHASIAVQTGNGFLADRRKTEGAQQKMPLQLISQMARKQITVGCFGADDFFEGGKHDQSFDRQQVAKTQTLRLETQLTVTIVFQDLAVIPLQQLCDGLAVVIRGPAASGHVQAGGHHDQPHRFGFEQVLQTLDIQLAVSQHRPFDHPHARLLKQAQQRPVARRLDHYRGVPEAQHGDQDFQHAPKIGADVNIIGVPAPHRRRGVARGQGGAQFQFATGL